MKIYVIFVKKLVIQLLSVKLLMILQKEILNFQLEIDLHLLAETGPLTSRLDGREEI